MDALDVVEGVGAVVLLFVLYGMSMRGTRGGAGCASCGTIRARVSAVGQPPILDDVATARSGGDGLRGSAGDAQPARNPEMGGSMEIRIFGPGCPRCHELEARTREALGALNRDASVTKVEDIMEIAAAGALRTPAMQINGRFVLQGRVPGVRELTTMLAKAFDAEP